MNTGDLNALLRELIKREGVGVFLDVCKVVEECYPVQEPMGVLGGYAKHKYAHEATSSLMHAFLCDELLSAPSVLSVEVGRHSMMLESQMPEDFVSSLGVVCDTQDYPLMERVHKFYLGEQTDLSGEPSVIPEWIPRVEQEKISCLFEFWKQARLDWLGLDETYGGFNRRIEKSWVGDDDTFMALYRQSYPDVYEKIFHSCLRQQLLLETTPSKNFSTPRARKL